MLTQLELADRHVKLQETFENLLEGEYGESVGVDVEPFLDDAEGDANGVAAGQAEDLLASLLGGGANKRQRL